MGGGSYCSVEGYGLVFVGDYFAKGAYCYYYGDY